MVHRGIRSKFSKMKKAAYHYLLTTSYRDRQLAETVCRIDTSAIISHVQQQFPHEPVEMSIVQDLEKGEVLVDSRGRGTLQTVRG